MPTFSIEFNIACLLCFFVPPPPRVHTLTHPVRANYEDGGTGLVRKHDFTRSESENWRLSRDEQNGEDEEGGGWRLAGSRRDSERWCPPSPGGSLHIFICLLVNCSLISTVLHHVYAMLSVCLRLQIMLNGFPRVQICPI